LPCNEGGESGHFLGNLVKGLALLYEHRPRLERMVTGGIHGDRGSTRGPVHLVGCGIGPHALNY